jgi:hypothetical protein
MKRSKTVLGALFALIALCNPLFATLWAPSEKTDPLTAEKVAGWEIVSYGSYIYDWPSKYDLVYWPLTDEDWICTNPKNGYSAFNDDFENLSKSEVRGLKDWLATNYNPSRPPVSFEEKLSWLEKVYGQRKMDDHFWCCFYRLMIYTHRKDPKACLLYVEKALPYLRHGHGEGLRRKERLYLLGEYSRLAGDLSSAKRYFQKAAGTSMNHEENLELIGMMCLGVVPAAILVARWKSKHSRIVAVLYVVAICAGGTFVYFKTRLPSAYLDGIIADRMDLVRAAQLRP